MEMRFSMIFAVLDDEKEVCLSLVDIFQREGLYGVYFTDPELFLKYDHHKMQILEYV